MPNIIMIGNSGSGKTTNMVTSYGVLKTILNNDVLFSKVDIRLAENREIERLYNTYCIELEEIPLTNKNKSYDFKFEAKRIIGKTVLQEYGLTDTIGGFSVASVDMEDNRILREKMMAADHILAFFSCIELLPENEKDYAIIGTFIDRILDNINYRIARSEKKLYLTLVFTKYDLIKDQKQKVHEIEDLFKGMIESRLPGLEIRYYFVSNHPDFRYHAELPILSVLTRLTIDEIRNDDSKFRRINPNKRLKIYVTKQLCEYIARESGIQWWKTMAGELDV